MCTNPYIAYQSAEISASGKRPLTQDKSKSLTGIPGEYPCRHCHECKHAYVKDWANRNLFENYFHEDSFFATFTYDEENCPHDYSLVRNHPQKLIKALRQAIAPIKIRFFQASEYGGQFQRPHFHALIYGWIPEDREPFKDKEGIITYESNMLEKIWGKGKTTLSEVNMHTARYVSGYINKKIYGQLAEDHYQTTHPITGDIVELEPEFCTMSRKPGIGLLHYQKWFSDYFPNDYMIVKGQRIAIPKYYDRQLEKDNPEMYEQVKHARKIAAKKPNRVSENTPERRAVRNKIHDIKLKRNLK